MCVFFHQDRRSLRGSKGQICHIIKVKFQTTSNCQTNGVNINMQNYPRGSVFAHPHWGPLLMAWGQRSIRSFDLLEKRQRQGRYHRDDTAISSWYFFCSVLTFWIFWISFHTEWNSKMDFPLAQVWSLSRSQRSPKMSYIGNCIKKLCLYSANLNFAQRIFIWRTEFATGFSFCMDVELIK